MGEQPRGHTFISVSEPGEKWRVATLHRTLEALGGIQHIKKAYAYTERDTSLSTEQMCDRITRNPEGGELLFDLAGIETTLWFPNFRHLSRFPLLPQGHIQYIELGVAKYDFGEPPGDPMRIELFAQQWAHLCEAQEAIAAIFTMGTLDEDVYIPEFVAALQTYDLEALAPGRNWRTYLAPTIAKRWEQALEESGIDRIEVLPSGGLVLTSELLRGYNPVSGNTDLIPNAQFLLEQIALHREIAGAEHLLALLSQQATKLQEIENQQAKTWSRENSLMEEQIRTQLHHIRATWACALQSPGLIGVAQTVPLESVGEASETIAVPVIAHHGHTWLYPTLSYPFDLHDPAWNAPQHGLENRIWHLLDAAQHNPIAGAPPRIIVYFWRNVSPQVHHALTQMGATVEIADHLPILP
jgi:hypothetical protein